MRCFCTSPGLRTGKAGKRSQRADLQGSAPEPEKLSGVPRMQCGLNSVSMLVILMQMGVYLFYPPFALIFYQPRLSTCVARFTCCDVIGHSIRPASTVSRLGRLGFGKEASEQ